MHLYVFYYWYFGQGFEPTYVVFGVYIGAALDHEVEKPSGVVSERGILKRRSSDVVSNVENVDKIFAQKSVEKNSF